MMDFKKLNIAGGWLSFAIALFTYVSTLEPTTSFWDCGEYIATSYRLEVGHPPGAPTFMMIGRAISMFAPPDQVAYMINLLSALCSALTILFLFWTISYLARKFLPGEEMKGANQIAVLGSAFVGALACTFSDTFWFSAVEGEVYAMSSFCTALVFWAIFKWEAVADKPHSTRWLIFIWYVIGLSIGVHLLNLLAIPAIIFVYYFKRYEPSLKGILISLAVSVGILGFVQMVLIPQIVNISAKFELLFVNSFGMPFHAGSLIFALLLIGLIAFGLWFTQKRGQVLANTALLSFTVLLIGYTSFGMILVRSNANPPIDENNPENMVNLLSYLNREQYGDVPLLTGQYFNTPLNTSEDQDGNGRVDQLDMYEDGKPVYYPDEESGTYKIADEKKNAIPYYDRKFTGFFPRMWSSKANHVRAYKAWSDFKGRPMRYRAITGEMQTINKPTFGENMKFFFRYQVWWMWGRYLMWNFAGRQNDIQGHGIDGGQLTDGNWVSGIPFVDEMRLGNMDNYPEELSNNRAYNRFYLLPLLLGIIGLIFQYKYDPKNALVVLLLFLFTGIAIAVFLNNYPYQPRERDYAFVGSFFTFTIWIGLGVVGIYKALRDKFSPQLVAVATTVVCLLAVPILMAAEGWDDHDRSGRYTAREIAKNYLDSCAPNAILFTNGDNDTFPLWYLQEVEGYRTDVRVVNLMLLNTDWYIESMARKAYDGDGIPISMQPDQYRQGTRDFLRFGQVRGIEKDRNYDIKKIVDFITSDETRQVMADGSRDNIVPTKNFRLRVDKQKVLANGTVPADQADQIVDEITWRANGNYILKNELAVWDILANFNWERPIYFSITMGTEAFFGLTNYFQQEGFAYRLVPIKTEQQSPRNYGRVYTERMYNNLINEFEWGGYENPELFMDENNQRFITNIRFTFSRLAEDLIAQGDNEQAAIVLDRCAEVCIHENASYNGTLLPIIEGYYRIGQNEKANEILRKVRDRDEAFLRYYFQQDPQMVRVLEGPIQQSLSSLGQLTMLSSQRYPQEGLGDEMRALYQEISVLYSQSVQR